VLGIAVTRYLKLPIKILRRKPTLDFSGTKDRKKVWLRIKGKYEQKETSKKKICLPVHPKSFPCARKVQ
jgi:hypothetical protein